MQATSQKGVLLKYKRPVAAGPKVGEIFYRQNRKETFVVDGITANEIDNIGIRSIPATC